MPMFLLQGLDTSIQLLLVSEIPLVKARADPLILSSGIANDENRLDPSLFGRATNVVDGHVVVLKKFMAYDSLVGLR